MKPLLLLILTGIALLTLSCNESPLKNYALQTETLSPPPLINPGPRQQAIPFFLAGTYVAEEKAAYCDTFDTLVINKQRNGLPLYAISRTILFLRKTESRSFKPDQQHFNWTGSYDHNAHRLYVVSEGLQLEVDPAEATLEIDGIAYKKIE